MEKEMQKSADELMSTPGVVGVLCADKLGMCLMAQGVANPNYSGSLASLSQLASMLEQSETDPIILFESQDKSCMVHREDNVTLAVYKAAV